MENLKTKGVDIDKVKKILLVEDDESTRMMYLGVLKEKGLEVIEAIDGVDGLEKAIAENPDLIFTGIKMPKMDGFKMFEELKKNPVTSQIPVAISSHMGREEDQKKAMQIGAKDFIPRDFNSPKQVADRLYSIISGSNTYNIKIVREELDAPDLINDLGINKDLKCENCGNDIVLTLTREKEMKAKFICPKCDIGD